MSSYRLSNKALEDLLAIISYTLDRWGIEQAQKYRNDFYNCCELIGKTPEIGRACDPLGHGLRRMEQGRHVIFYKLVGRKVVISRILHQKVLPLREYFIDG